MFCLVDEVPTAIVSLFDSSDASDDSITAAACIQLFIFKVKKLSLSQRCIAIPLQNIVRKCVHIPMKHSASDYIVTIPNSVEHH